MNESVIEFLMGVLVYLWQQALLRPCYSHFAIQKLVDTRRLRHRSNKTFYLYVLFGTMTRFVVFFPFPIFITQVTLGRLDVTQSLASDHLNKPSKHVTNTQEVLNPPHT